jgi:hypothetical protein
MESPKVLYNQVVRIKYMDNIDFIKCYKCQKEFEYSTRRSAYCSDECKLGIEAKSLASTALDQEKRNVISVIRSGSSKDIASAISTYLKKNIAPAPKSQANYNDLQKPLIGLINR